MGFLSKKNILISIIIIFSANVSFISALSFYNTQKHLINNEALVIANGLRLRSEPKTTSKILHSFEFGETLKVIEIKKGYQGDLVTINGVKNYWWKVETEKKLIGWVFAEYMGYPFYKDKANLIYVKWRSIENLGYTPILTVCNKKEPDIEYYLLKNIKHNEVMEYNKIRWVEGANEPLLHGDLKIFSPDRIGVDSIKIEDKKLKIIKISGAFFEGPTEVDGGRIFKSELWFLTIKDKISLIFNNIEDYGYYYLKVGIELKNDDSKNIKEIIQTYNYIPAKFTYKDFNSKILNNLKSEKDINVITKYYLNNIPAEISWDDYQYKIIDKIKNKGDKSFIESCYPKNEAIVLNKILTKDQKVRIQKIFKSINYLPDYFLDQTIPNDKLKEASKILKISDYKWKTFTFHYRWNGSRFVLKEKIFPNSEIVDTIF